MRSTAKLLPEKDEKKKDRTLSVDDVLSEIPFGAWKFYLIAAGASIQMADGMQVTLLTFLDQCASGSLSLNASQGAMIVAIIFLGEFFGAVLTGPLSDAFGRKKITISTGFILTIFGLLSAASNGYYFFLVTRFMVGVAVGLYPVNFDLYAELLGSHRAIGLSITTACFPLGAVLCTGAAWLWMDSFGWRFITTILSLPSALGLIAMIYAVEESPQFLLNSGKTKEAIEVLTRIVDREQDGRAVTALDKFVAIHDDDDDDDFDTENSRFIDDASSTSTHYGAITPSHTTAQDISCCTGSPCLLTLVLTSTEKLRLMTQRYPSRSIIVLILWASLGTMYGLQILTSRVFNTSSSGDSSCTFAYGYIFLTYAVAFLGAVTIPPLLLDRLGRVTLLVASLLVTTCCLLPLTFSSTSTVLEIILVSTILASMNVSFAGGWVITPELFDTSVRATAHTSAFAVSRISAFFMTSIYGYTLSIPSLATALGGCMFIGMICAATLPDTRMQADGRIANLSEHRSS